MGLAGACVASLLLLAACAREDAAPTVEASQQAPLPQPQQPGGPLTAMPGAPGPGDVPLGGSPPAPAPAPAPVDPLAEGGLLPLEDNPETGLAPTAESIAGDAAAAAPEPGPEAAAAVIRTYYAAINALDFSRAYTLWSDGGRASGQTPEQFAEGFADTAAVLVDLGAPRNPGAATGSRFIEIPVTLRAQQRDGSSRRFAGHYVLRRAVVDGASSEQRGWRIASADLQEAPPATP
ncbi:MULTISPECIES: hypothetical protein [Luteimonas]|uniref:hypothetical protein n=1 Tax=Luteimonas TaxID=83614 RepID=UPI000C7B0563|nr:MULTISPECIES: hypothetical protein [Luteimonas]